MKIIDSHTVEMTTTDERLAQAAFERMLDAGYSIYVSAKRIEELRPGLDPAFYRWLRDEPLLGFDRTQHREWHRETWAFITDNLRELLQANGFEVHVNGAAGELTVIERSTSKALTVAPKSNTMTGVVTGTAALS